MWRQGRQRRKKKDVNRRSKFTEGMNQIVVMYPVEKRKDRKRDGMEGSRVSEDHRVCRSRRKATGNISGPGMYNYSLKMSD